MALYVYECVTCKARLQRLRPMEYRHLAIVCPSCGGTMENRLALANWSRGKGWGIYGNRPGYGKEERGDPVRPGHPDPG